MDWLSDPWRSLLSFIGGSVLSAAFITGLAFLARDVIRGWLTAKAKHRYDEQLETLRAANARTIEEMRAGFARELEGLKAELAKSGKEVEALRAAPMGARAARQAQIDKRRLEAVDQLWGAVKDLGPGKAAAAWMAVLNYEAIADAAKDNQQVRDMFKGMAASMGLDKPLVNSSHAARPFVSPLAWALFSAFGSAVGMTQARLVILQTGVGSDVLNKPESVIKLLAEALPDWKEYIEKTGVFGFPYILEELEKRLLAELQRSLAGEEDDANEIERARKIIDRVRDLDISRSTGSIPSELRQPGDAAAEQVPKP